MTPGRFPATTRCWNTAITSPSNAWARARNRALRWPRWVRVRNGARMPWWPASTARSRRSSAMARSTWTHCCRSTTNTGFLRRCGNGCVHAFRPSIEQLDGKRVALWGWGREGRAAWKAIRSRLPQLPLTLFCLPEEAAGARAMDDALLGIETTVDAARLSAFEVIVKSPGISPYRSEAVAAAEAGTRFIGGTALWFAERPDARTICVTGTKGKSTTSALLAHLLRAGGHRTALTGNIGQPLLELLDEDAAYWVVELSSYQTRDVARSGVRPAVAVVTNVFPEHLDWHGSEQRYVDDKLSLLAEGKPRIAVLNANDARLAAMTLPGSEVHWFGRQDG